MRNTRHSSLFALTFWFAACTGEPQQSKASRAATDPACAPGWVYLKDIASVESRRGVDLGERNVVLVGCRQQLATLTPRDRTALQGAFAPTVDQKDEGSVRDILKDPRARGKVTAGANEAIGRVVVADWHVDFWAMAF